MLHIASIAAPPLISEAGFALGIYAFWLFWGNLYAARVELRASKSLLFFTPPQFIATDGKLLL